MRKRRASLSGTCPTARQRLTWRRRSGNMARSPRRTWCSTGGPMRSHLLLTSTLLSHACHKRGSIDAGSQARQRAYNGQLLGQIQVQVQVSFQVKVTQVVPWVYLWLLAPVLCNNGGIHAGMNESTKMRMKNCKFQCSRLHCFLPIDEVFCIRFSLCVWCLVFGIWCPLCGLIVVTT